MKAAGWKIRKYIQSIQNHPLAYCTLIRFSRCPTQIRQSEGKISKGSNSLISPISFLLSHIYLFYQRFVPMILNAQVDDV